MSLINDALKRAKQAPPRNTPNVVAPLQPVAEESSNVLLWLLPAVIIILIFAAIFFIGWSVAHNAVRSIVTAPGITNQEVVVPPVPVIKPIPVATAPITPPDLPALQGIFYSPTKPSAIVDGMTVRPGDHYKQYRVKEITKSTVILVDAEGQILKLGM
jgi:hypothetical protein